MIASYRITFVAECDEEGKYQDNRVKELDAHGYYIHDGFVHFHEYIDMPDRGLCERNIYTIPTYNIEEIEKIG